MISTVMAPVASRKTLNNTYRYARGTISVLIDGSETRGTFALLEMMQMPGSEPPLHVHQHEDETFYVLEGRISVWVGGQVHHLEAGGSIFLPRGVPHTFRIKSAEARALNYLSPAGFEEWFRVLGTPAESFGVSSVDEGPTNEEVLRKAEELGPRLGVSVIGPSPEF